MNDRPFAAIDIGTNTAMLLVATLGEDGALTVLRDEETVTRLGQGVDRTGQLDAGRIDFVEATVKRYAEIAKELGANRVPLAATSASRDAANGAELLQRLAAVEGVHPRVLDGKTEAAWSFLAVQHAAHAWPDAHGSMLGVLDIGGGSTEFAVGSRSTMTARCSLQVGSVRLTERHSPKGEVSESSAANAREDVRRAWNEALAQKNEALDGFAERRRGAAPYGLTLVAVGATATTVAALAHGQPREGVEGVTLSRVDVQRVFQSVSALPSAERERLHGIPPGRADVLPMGAIVLDELLGALGLTDCRVSDRGLRYGILLAEAGWVPRAST